MPAQQVNLRIDAHLLARIDANAQAAGQTRTEYLLSYLPETYEHTTEQPTPQDKAGRISPERFKEIFGDLPSDGEG